MFTTKPFSKNQIQTLILSSLGGVLEFYDFIIFIFLAPYLEQLFFANNTPFMATLKTLAIFSVGYLIRPLGGWLFSHFGDRQGRKVVFMSTVVFMALPSFAIGLLPTAHQSGILAPLMLLLLRILQGLALGGEIPAAITFVAEHILEGRRSLALAILFFGINLGLMLGSFITYALTVLFTEKEILSYAWRLPFLLGGFFGLISLYFRRYLQETSAFTDLKKEQLQAIPLISLFKTHSLKVLEGFSLVALGSVSVFLYLYWPQYLHQYMGYDLSQLMRLNTLGTLMLSLTILLGGLLGDHFGYRRVYLSGALGLVVVTLPLFLLFDQGEMQWVYLCYCVFSLIFGIIPSNYAALLADLFPTSMRFTGIATSYNLAYALIGGLSPVLCTVIIHYFNSKLAPAFYLMSIASFSSLACLMKTSGKSPQPVLER